MAELRDGKRRSGQEFEDTAASDPVLARGKEQPRPKKLKTLICLCASEDGSRVLVERFQLGMTGRGKRDKIGNKNKPISFTSWPAITPDPALDNLVK